MATLTQILQHVLDEKDPSLSPATKRILVKEVLQAHVLDFIYNHPRYRRLHFYGGTCLHVVYGLNRLSEDLDFDNSQGTDRGYSSRPGWNISTPTLLAMSRHTCKGEPHIVEETRFLDQLSG